ncbi:Citrate CoA transferases subunit alpha of citrate lyase [Thermoproteus uzoniensis 768-20]|uniref:Citrate CoA transferases subunit alpha of citrate lyase n=1 Tax=Thermoproteus uzoniensis (strain 768-20) TaxID=999630 RepID=F2L5Q5_THEU7|nr:CaiB/BaiF CoA-transferase family protein [Thermoproteus uzoniensis]AEA13601.1 Citrate CoA transferases subunit alpha of citrate lyase [Thermoproteus uzoniensis 768-20]
MYRAVELGHVIAGPYAGLLLAQLGFDVVKVEPVGGDPTRRDDVMGDSIFVFLNRGKRSVALDLKRPEGREIFLKLVERSDVLVENLAPGALERLGLGRDVLFGANKNLVHCSIKGYPSGGAKSNWPAFGTLVEAVSGVMWSNGGARLPASITDMGAGLYCALTVLWALLQRRPGYYEVSLFQSDLVWLGYYIIALQTLGKIFEASGDKLPFWAPYELFKTADGEIYIAVANDAIWARLCGALRSVACSDPRFSTNAGRVQHREELHKILEAETSRYRTDELLRLLLEHDVPAAPMLDIRAAAADEDASWDTTSAGGRDGVRVPRLPLPGSLHGARAPNIGEHTREVLRELGYGDSEIEQLIGRGVVRA